VPIVLARAVIDTSVLFIVLGLHYIQRAHLPEPKRRSILALLDDSALREQRRQDAYLQLVAGIRAALITSHVIGELQGLQISRLKLSGDDVKHFGSHCIDFLLLKNFDEQLVRLLKMRHGTDRQRLELIGPPDAGLIRLALAERCPILTNDVRTLSGRARQAGVECLIARDLVADGPT
jgi:rRNA-processing protein FCF1